MRAALAERVGVAIERLPGLAREAVPEPPAVPAPTAMRKPVIRAPQRRMPGPPRTAIRLLLQDPRLAEQITAPASLAGTDDPDLPLLQRLIEHLQRNPGTSLGALLGYWYGTPEGELLTQLAATEPLSGADIEREFADVLQHIRQQASRLTADIRRRELESIPFAEMSSTQKQQYRELLSGKSG